MQSNVAVLVIGDGPSASMICGMLLGQGMRAFLVREINEARLVMSQHRCGILIGYHKMDGEALSPHLPFIKIPRIFNRDQFLREIARALPASA